MTSSTDLQDREMLVIYENLDNIPQTTTWWRKVLCGKDYHVQIHEDQQYHNENGEIDIIDVLQTLFWSPFYEQTIA